MRLLTSGWGSEERSGSWAGGPPAMPLQFQWQQ